MKRFLSSLLCCTLFSMTVQAQDFPSYGIISDQESTLKECAFDKEAPAVVLLDEAVANHNDDGNLIMWRHVRIKILKESGFDYANIEIPYYRKNKLESVDKVEAIVTNINPDGSSEVTRVDKKSFYDKQTNELWSKVIFTFPNIKVGSIIEYKYMLFGEHFGLLEDWKFHDYLPVVKSAFTLYVPPRLEFTYKVLKQPEYPIIITPTPSEAKMYFEMNNIPGLDDEPYMDARKDYMQKITFQISGYNNGRSGFQKVNTTWKEVIDDFQSSSSFGSQLRKNLSGAGDFIDKTKLLGSDEAKMKAIFDFVRLNMTWNGFHSLYAGDGIKDAWNKRTGTNGQINLILVNLLRDAGLDASPMLVSERWHGKVKTDYPFIDQFNTVFAYVQVGDKKYYLDATDKYTPYNVIPKDILNTSALIVNRKTGGITEISNDATGAAEYVNSMIEVKAGGKLEGEVVIKSDGYARIEKLAYIKENGEDKFVSTFFKKDNLSISEFKLLNKETDSLPAEQQFKFTQQLTASGDYLLVPLHSFSGFRKNPFLSSNRFSNINFGFKRTINLYTSVQLPQGFTPEMPRPIRITTPDQDISFGRTVQYDKENNSVICMVTIEFKKSLYNYYEYEVLQQVYKKIYEFLDEPLVLKKKS